jgi:hypothetical protein
MFDQNGLVTQAWATWFRDMYVRSGGSTATTVAEHIADATAAHQASAIGFSPTGTIAAISVQAAIAEVASEAAPLSHVHSASDITTGTLVAARGGTGVDLSAATGIVKAAAGVVSAATLVDADVSASAAIARSKIATGTASQVVVNDGSGVLSGVSPGSSGNVLTSDGTSWTSSASAAAPDSSQELSNLTLAASVASNALTVALKSKAGSDPSGGDPVSIGFRNATAATGTYTRRTVTGALSVVVSSGSTLGHISAVTEYVYVYAIDNAGTVELAVSSRILDEGSVVTTTAEGGAGAADSRSVVYSTTARSNVPVRLIGRLKVSEATAGTWATAPSEISVMPCRKLEPRTAAAQIAMTGTGSCSTTSASDNWIASYTPIGTGRCTINFTPGYFSAVYSATVTPTPGVGASVFTVTSAPTTTSVDVGFRDSASAALNSNFSITVVGAH